MRVTEDTSERWQVQGAVDGTFVGLGLMFGSLPLFALAAGANAPDGAMVTASTALLCWPLAAWMLQRGTSRRIGSVVIDRALGTIVITGMGFAQPDVEVPFADVVDVVPFDRKDREFTDTFTLRIETRTHGQVRLAVLPVPNASIFDSFSEAPEGGDPREIARSAAAHAEAANRLRGLMGIAGVGADPGRARGEAGR